MSEVVQNSLRSLRRARNGRGGPRQLRGLVTQCLSEATRSWAALRRCPRPPQHPRGAAPARQHAIEAEGTWVDAENGRSAARQPRAPLTRCLPEVPPASDHLRRRAPAAPPPRKPTSSEHQREGALGRQKTGVPAGAEPANPGAPSPGVYPRCPPPQLASAGALPRSAASDALPPDHCPLGVGPVTTRVRVSKFLKLAIHHDCPG